MIKHKNKIITAVIVLIIAACLFYFKDQIFTAKFNAEDTANKSVSAQKVTTEFYNQWLTDLKSTSTTPYKSGLLDSTVLSAEVRTQIQKARANREEGSVDPVLCLPRTPNRIDVQELDTTDNKASMLVVPRDKRITTEHQAVVGLTKVSDQWIITKINCMVGETMLESEFSFEKSGVLLKESIEAPYSKENWHLVYEQELQPGFVVPLIFDAQSVCVNSDSTEYTCDPNKLTETTKVYITGNMTETGAAVKRMTFE